MGFIKIWPFSVSKIFRPADTEFLLLSYINIQKTCHSLLYSFTVGLTFPRCTGTRWSCCRIPGNTVSRKSWIWLLNPWWTGIQSDAPTGFTNCRRGRCSNGRSTAGQYFDDQTDVKYSVDQISRGFTRLEIFSIPLYCLHRSIIESLSQLILFVIATVVLHMT